MTRTRTTDHRSTGEVQRVASRDAAPPDRVRRQLLSWAAVVPLTVCVSLRANAQAAAGNLPHVTPDDPAAKALGYVADASTVDPKANPMFKPGSNCANCLQYQAPATEPWGPCAVLPGKAVSAKGWCKVWVKKP